MIIQTRNTRYRLTDHGDGAFLISGNYKYCIHPTPVRIDQAPVVGYPFTYIIQDHGERHGHRILTTAIVSIEE